MRSHFFLQAPTLMPTFVKNAAVTPAAKLFVTSYFCLAPRVGLEPTT